MICPHCNGRGQVEVMSYDNMEFYQQTCFECDGTGEIKEMKHTTMTHTTKVVTKVEHTIVIKKLDLLFWLKRKESVPVNDSVSVTITVPGGGDWSNQVLDINEVGGIVVKWTETSEE